MFHEVFVLPLRSRRKLQIKATITYVEVSQLPSSVAPGKAPHWLELGACSG